MNLSKSTQNGFLAFLTLGVYFLIIDVSGYAESGFLRLFNFLILIYFMNKSVKSTVVNGQTGFLKQFFSAFTTASVAVVLSVLGLAGYLSFIAGSEHIMDLAAPLLGTGTLQLTLSEFCFSILAEGMASSLIASFVLMQYWKNSVVNKAAN